MIKPSGSKIRLQGKFLVYFASIYLILTAKFGISIAAGSPCGVRKES
jgi:hypothetical protein